MFARVKLNFCLFYFNTNNNARYRHFSEEDDKFHPTHRTATDMVAIGLSNNFFSEDDRMTG